MHRVLVALSLTAIVLGVPSVVQAVDIWDFASDHDDIAASTRNVLWHTAPAQNHDLEAQRGVPDQDWFRIHPRARRSYEVQIVNVTGDTEVSGMRRYAADGATLLQTGVPLDEGASTSTLRWIQGPRGSPEFVQVTAGRLSLSAASQYSIQLRETTLYCARYGNSGTQVSMLLVQRTDPDNANACAYEVRYNSPAGTEVGSTTGTLAHVAGGNAMNVIATQAEPGVGGTSGSAFIAHSCGFGGINAKVIQIDPTTGFSFDVPCVTRLTN